VTEDFRIAVRAFGRGDWETALRHFRNASQVEPDAPDIYYLIGEAQRMLEEPGAALASYNQALDISPGFAPAFLGRALASLDLHAGAEIGEDLDRAIEYDPNFAEARLQRAGVALRRGDLEAAQQDLEAAEAIIPGSPLLAYYHAQALQLAGDRESALEFARQAYDLDRTYLPAYRLLGEMALANAEFELAQEVLDTYLQYEPGDAQGWVALGQSYMRISGPEDAYAGLVHSMVKDDLEAAMEAFEHAQELDEELPGVYLSRAVTYLALGEGQNAVNELMSARRLEPNSFAINLGLGRALLAAGRVGDALSQINSCERLAQDEDQMAGFYYWRALAIEANSAAIEAVPDWQALLALPEDAVPAAWLRVAQQHLLALTPTATATNTPTLTSTARATPTPKVSKTSSPTPRRTSTPTSTPKP
jgi:tetratricopeptide (TPR) repeat protein